MHFHTPYGLGEEIGRESVRGRTQVLVAGRGFRMWFAEQDVRVASEGGEPGGLFSYQFTPDKQPKLAPWQLLAEPEYHEAAYENDERGDHVDEDNSTTLPYNPDPQYSDLFATESTLQPGEHEIDRDERLHPADSLSFEDRAEPEGPQPNPDLFAKSANLPDKYASWMLEAGAADHFNDPVQRFRDDPIREIRRIGHVLSEAHSPQMDEYGMLIEADREMREAAWADVRDKAKRLRAEGSVDINDIGPNRIYATVKGDHGTYDVRLVVGGEFAGFGRGRSVGDWNCACGWGKWAFKRQYKHVGRLCSHAYATLLEAQSRYLKDNPEHFRSRTASVVSDFTAWAEDNGAANDTSSAADFIAEHPEFSDDEVADLLDFVTGDPARREVRDFEDPMGHNWPDVLNSEPGRLTPDLIFPAEDDEGDRRGFTDLGDDRETTGPDQIVHFSRFLYGDDTDPTPEFFGGDAQITPGFIGGGGDIAGGAPTPSTPEFFGGEGSPSTDFVGGGTDTASPASGDFIGGGLDTTNPGGTTGGDDFFGPSGLGGGSPATDSFIGPGLDGGASAPNASGADAIAPGDYTIQSGDTLSDIAERSGYGGDYQSLADANDIADPDTIYAGDTINIPGQGASGDTAASTPDTGAADPALGSSADSGATAADPALPPGGAADVSAQEAGKYDLGAGPSITDPGLTAPGTTEFSDAGTEIDNKGFWSTGSRFLYADEDFEEDAPAPDITTDPAEPGVAGNEHAGTGAAPGPTDIAEDPAEPGVAGNEALYSGGGGGGMGFDPSMIMDVAGPVISGLSGFAAPLAEGLGGAISTGLSGILGGRYAHIKDADLLEKLRDLSAEPRENSYGHMDERNDQLAYVVEELRNRGYDVSQMVAHVTAGIFPGDHDAFQGSGADPKHWWGTSESYVEENERPHHVDVTDLDGDIIKYSEDPPQQKKGARGVRPIGQRRTPVTAAVTPRDPSYRPPENFGYDGSSRISAERVEDTSDIVRSFHASLQATGGGAFAGEGDGGQYSDNDIATRAASMLRTAGRHYTPAEQRALEDEFHPLGARNLPTEADLQGTHYAS